MKRWYEYLDLLLILKIIIMFILIATLIVQNRIRKITIRIENKIEKLK